MTFIGLQDIHIIFMSINLPQLVLKVLQLLPSLLLLIHQLIEDLPDVLQLNLVLLLIEIQTILFYRIERYIMYHKHHYKVSS